MRGLWIGQTAAAGFACLMTHLIVKRIDWDLVISKNKARKDKEEDPFEVEDLETPDLNFYDDIPLR